MSSSNRSKKNYKYAGPKTYEATDGLDDFLRVLEKYFFATAKVKCKHDSLNNRTDLIIDLFHNFGIAGATAPGPWGPNSATTFVMSTANSPNSTGIPSFPFCVSTRPTLPRLFNHPAIC